MSTPADPEAIDTPEVSRHLEFVRAAVEAPDDDQRDAILGEAIVQFGPRFLGSVMELQAAAAEQGEENPLWGELVDATLDRLGSWLTGVTLTDRADEADRRAVTAYQLLDQLERPALVRQVSLAILALPEDHPLRDVAKVRAFVDASLAQPEAETTPDDLLRTLAVLGGDLADLDELDGVEARAAPLLEQADAESVEIYRIAMLGRYLLEAIAARDAGDEDGRRRWNERARPHLDALAATGSPRALLMAAMSADQADDHARAAELYDAVPRHPDVAPEQSFQAALAGGRAHWASGDAAGAVDRLAPWIPDLVRRYGEAVTASDVASAAYDLARAGEHLALAFITLERWNDALRTLDQLKSTRFRFRQALRSVEAGRALLDLERKVLDVQRGVPVDLPPPPDDPGDRLRAGVPTLATLLEAYRAERPRVDPALAASPGIAEVAAVLEPGEVAVVLGLTYDGTVVAIVTPESSDAPAATVLDTSRSRDDWLGVLAGENEDGWLYAIGAPEAPLDRPAALRRLVEVADEALGRRILELLGGVAPERMCVIPHGLLHFVPFHALASVRDAVVTTVPSAAQLVHERQRQAGVLRGRAAVVADPTLDLSLSSSELQSLRSFATAAGLEMTELSGRAATEAAVIDACRAATVVHLSGHGQSDITAPDASALLLAPPASIEGDPFPAWVSAADAWTDIDEEERTAVVPGVGVLKEKRLLDGAWVERTMDLPDRCTIWAHEREGRLRALAERWSAGDLLVDDAFDTCALLVLSACESAVGGLGLEIDEQSGLPAALALAGAGTVVATQWPVDEGVAALTVELLYDELAQQRGLVDVAALVAGIRRRLRTMPRDEAAARAETLRRRVEEPRSRMLLEAMVRRLRRGEDHPFANAWDWAAFVVAGRGQVVIGAEP